LKKFTVHCVFFLFVFVSNFTILPRAGDTGDVQDCVNQTFEIGIAALFAQVHQYSCPMHCEGLTFHEPGQCPVCGMNLEEDKPEESAFFDGETLSGAKSIEERKRQTALMPGLNVGYYYTGWIGYILAILLGWKWGDGLKVASRREERKRGISSAFMSAVFKRRWLVRSLQIVSSVLFFFVIYAGLFGNQNPGRNIAPVLTWNIWWMSLIFFAFFLGQSWCTICPWMATPDFFNRLFARTPKLRWPKRFRNVYLALLLFTAMTWVELVYDAPYNPALTAQMGLAMVVIATFSLIFFERKSFCRYGCMVGRVTGIFGTTGLLAFRRDDSKVCKSCESKACYHGNEKGLPCPTFEFMGAMNDNSNCTMCTECLHTCPHDNILVEWRAPFTDLLGPHRRRLDESVFLIAILGFSIFHGIEMVPFWRESIFDPFWTFLAETIFDPGFLVTYTFLMLAFLALVFVVFWIFVFLSRRLSGNRVYTTRSFFITFAYITLPVSLAYHIAHNSLHFFYEGSKLVRLMSDPMGLGWDLFGSADMPLTMLIPMPILWALQIVCMVLGLFVSVGLVSQGARRLIGNRRQLLGAKIPLIMMLAVFSALCLWLLFQPMEMRTGTAVRSEKIVSAPTPKDAMLRLIVQK